jgi:hypothetical protein
MAPPPVLHNLEALLRIVAVRQALDQFAIGHWYPTSSALGNLAHVLIRASQHAGIADAERWETTT